MVQTFSMAAQRDAWTGFLGTSVPSAVAESCGGIALQHGQEHTFGDLNGVKIPVLSSKCVEIRKGVRRTITLILSPTQTLETPPLRVFPEPSVRPPNDCNTLIRSDLTRLRILPEQGDVNTSPPFTNLSTSGCGSDAARAARGTPTCGVCGKSFTATPRRRADCRTCFSTSSFGSVTASRTRVLRRCGNVTVPRRCGIVIVPRRRPGATRGTAATGAAAAAAGLGPTAAGLGVAADTASLRALAAGDVPRGVPAAEGPEDREEGLPNFTMFGWPYSGRDTGMCTAAPSATRAALPLALDGCARFEAGPWSLWALWGLRLPAGPRPEAYCEEQISDTSRLLRSSTVTTISGSTGLAPVGGSGLSALRADDAGERTCGYRTRRVEHPRAEGNIGRDTRAQYTHGMGPSRNTQCLGCCAWFGVVAFRTLLRVLRAHDAQLDSNLAQTARFNPWLLLCHHCHVFGVLACVLAGADCEHKWGRCQN